jgi:nucleoside-diphosphate-sugar epimerase
MYRSTVSILGCGWTGKALAKQLAADKYKIHCLSRDIEANDNAHMYTCDTLVIAIPPRGNYIDVLEETLTKIDVTTQVILLSSISFYDGKPLVVEAEGLVGSMHAEVTVLRLGGLMGYERIAGKYTAGKVLTSDSRTNYIHKDDVVGIIESVIVQNIRSEIFDVVAPIQSSKKKIFAKNAKRFGFKETEFLDGDEKGKMLSPTKLCNVLGYAFKKEDVEKFW